MCVGWQVFAYKYPDLISGVALLDGYPDYRMVSRKILGSHYKQGMLDFFISRFPAIRVRINACTIGSSGMFAGVT